MAKMYLDNQPVRIIKRSKNQLIPFPYQTKEGTSIWNDITYSHLQNGVVIANGNANNGTDYHSLSEGELSKIGFEVGKTYTLSGSVGSNGAGMWRIKVELRDEKNGYILDINQYDAPVSFTIPQGAFKYKVLVIIGTKEELKNLTFYPMLNEGTVAKPYEPFNQYFRIRTGANFRNPANLIPFPYDIGTIEQDGVTLTVGKGGEITLNGTATKNSFFYIKRELNIPKGTYTFSGNSKPSSDYTYYLYNPNKDKYYHQHSNNPTTFTLNEEQILLLMIRANANITLDNVVIYPMLFEGETTKPYYIQD